MVDAEGQLLDSFWLISKTLWLFCLVHSIFSDVMIFLVTGIQRPCLDQSESSINDVMLFVVTMHVRVVGRFHVQNSEWIMNDFPSNEKYGRKLVTRRPTNSVKDTF